MNNQEYWNKVEDYAQTFANFGNDWLKEDIIEDMARCRYGGEWLLNTMSEEEFNEFSNDVADVYFDNYYMKEVE